MTDTIFDDATWIENPLTVGTQPVLKRKIHCESLRNSSPTPSPRTNDNRRYTLRAIPKLGRGEDDTGGTDSEEDLEEDSRSAGPNAKALKTRHDYADHDASPPRVKLLDLPIEILEHVATSLRRPVPVLEAASRYIDDRFSDFAKARFALSAYSKTCSTLRPVVERVLYRDVQLDFTRWKGRKHTKWPAGNLPLLLRTLEARPQLGRYINAAALDFQLSTKSPKSEALEDGLERFLELTPYLKTLFLEQCPLALWNFPPLNITTFATTFAPGIIPSILTHFPKLQNLYLRDCGIMVFMTDLPKHNLKTIRLDSNHEHAAAHLSRAAMLCSNTVEHLDIRFIGGLLHQSPNFTPKVAHIGPSPATNLRSLRLDNISVFSHLDTAYIQVLQSLVALEHLHVSHHSYFAIDAFRELPPRLCRLKASQYYGCWEIPPNPEPDKRNRAFMVGFADNIVMADSKISRVVGSSGNEPDRNLQLVFDVCKSLGKEYREVEASDSFVEI
ncbi:hypothetical protein H0H92_014035, partial [Tricholoma furcatifolium]